MLNLWRICPQCRRPGLDPWIRKILWRSIWQPTPVFLPGEFLAQTSLVGYSQWSCKETWLKQLTHTHTHTHTHTQTHTGNTGLRFIANQRGTLDPTWPRSSGIWFYRNFIYKHCSLEILQVWFQTTGSKANTSIKTITNFCLFVSSAYQSYAYNII